MELSRRDFFATGLVAAAAAAQETVADGDSRALVSQGDLIYDKPAERSEAGIPIGNGRMGTLVWTTPTTLQFQINRVDVYANNSATNSFVERHNDYCGGCAFVDIDLGASGGEYHFHQKVSASIFPFMTASLRFRERAFRQTSLRGLCRTASQLNRSRPRG